MLLDKQEVLERVRADNVKFISLQFTDIVGTIKNVANPRGPIERSHREGGLVRRAPPSRVLLASTRAIWF